MKKENPEILNNFLNYLLSVKSFSIETINSYNIDLLLFFYFIKEYLELKIEVKDFNKFVLLQVKEGDIIAFLVYCNHSRNNNVYTRQRKLMAIRCFYKWLFQNFPNDNVLKNPTEDIKSINKIQRIPKYLNLQEAKSIQNVFNLSNCKNPIRNNAIICLFLTAGLRVSELISINFKDIDFNNKTIQIFGKGGKERTAYFNEYCKKQLLNYIKERNKNIKKVPLNDYLFLNSRKQKFKRNGIYYICKKAYKLIKIDDKHYSTHTLRHTSATLLYMYVKEDMLLLKEFLGHSSITSTEIYTHIKNNKIKEAVNKNPLNEFILEEYKKSA